MATSITALEMTAGIERAQKRCEEVLLPIFGESSQVIYMLAIALTASAITTELLGEQDALSLAEETTGLMGLDTDMVNPTEVANDFIEMFRPQTDELEGENNG